MQKEDGPQKKRASRSAQSAAITKSGYKWILPANPSKTATNTERRGRNQEACRPRLRGILSGKCASSPGMTELDSHANWPAFGDNSTDLMFTSKTVQVHGYDSQLGNQSLSIRHKAVAHNCPYGQNDYLHSEQFTTCGGQTTNLIQQWLLREAGNTVNDIAKQHLTNPSSDDPCIINSLTNQKIHLELNGTFSGFRSRALSQHEIDNIDD